MSPRAERRTPAWPWSANPAPPPWLQKPAVISRAIRQDLPRGRVHRRATVRTEIWIGQGGIFTRSPGVLRDLSEGGAFVQTAQRFPVGSLLNLRFKLPRASHFVNGTVAVKHTGDGAGLGVKFVDLSDDDRRRVREFIDCHARSAD